MTHQTVTIFNRRGDDLPTRWAPHVLTGVHFRQAQGAGVSGSHISGGTEEALLLIPKNDHYLAPDAFAALADPTGFFTLQPGDAIAAGALPELSPTGAIQAVLPSCKLITGYVAHFYGSGLDHWEVSAR